MVLESNTLDVLFVKDGQQGEDGKVLYTWIKYAKDANGTGMTDDPNGAVYIGISYNNESSTESNDPTQYAWTKIQGADGKKGEDAYTIFLENENISFATDENRNPLSEQAYTSGITIMKGAKPVTDFTIGDMAKTQGIAVAKTDTAIAISVVNGNPLPSDSGEIVIPISVGGTVFKKVLTWTCAKKGDQGEKGEQGIQGPQGEQGIAGKDGTSVTIINKSITYQLSTSGTTIPTGTWQTSPQTIPEGQYQWTKTSVTYSDGNKTESYSISYHGKNGSDGTSVKTTSTSVKYQVGDSGTTKPTGTWQSNVPTVAQGKYLWTQTIVNYSDGNSTESYSVSYRGIDGSNGVNGMNAATVYLYQRATSTPNKPSNTLTYTFSTTKITGTLNNGWSTAIPTGTDAVYVTVASVSSKNDTATIATSAWSAPVVLAQNGKTGSDGRAGLNVATIYLYQRNISKPSKPSASVTYTFSTGVASGLNNGWSQKIPDGTNPLYVTLATASSNTATDTILSSEWSDVVVMAQNGEDGQDGISPKVSLSKSGNTTTISIVDATGTHTQTVKDGTNGTPGAAGKDGKTSYFHVKYSNDGGKTFTGNSGEDTGIYMGSYTDYTEVDSTDVKKYNWVKVKGDKGDTGQKGQDGTSIKITSKSVTYQTSTSGTTAPTGTWVTTVPTVANGQYLWTKTTVQYSDGNKTEAYSVSYKGTNGTNGTSVTISKTEVTYQVSTSGTTAPTGTWSTTMPSCDQGLYLWTKTYVKYSDGKETTSYSVSYKGVDGQDGQNATYITLKGSNFDASLNAEDLGLYLNGVKQDQQYSRGHMLCVIDPKTGNLETHQIYDTFTDPTCIIEPLNNIPKGKIIGLYSSDATQVSGDMRNILLECGSNDTSTWGQERRSHVFIGMKGLQRGQAYEKKLLSTEDGGLISLTAYYTQSGLVVNGASGDNAKNLSITPSSQYFKSTDGGKTFAPDTITIKPTIQGEISFGKWQYSIDGGVSFADIVSGQKGLTINNNVLNVSKDSSLYSDAVTMVTFRAVASDSNFYDTCSIAKIYDVSDIGDGRNLWITRDNITLQACEKDKYIYTTTGTSAVCIGADATSVGTNTIALQTGTKYTISFVISSPSEVGNALWYFCTALNSTGVKNYGGYGVKLVTGENIVSQTINVDTSCDAAGLVLYHLPTGCVIKDIQVEKGSSPTGWTPAPEDLQTAILSTKSEITDVSLKVDKNKQAIEQRVEKTTYQQDLNLVKGDINKANEGLNKWRYEIYPKSLFASEYQGKSTMDVFAKNTNLTPSQSVLINDTNLGKSFAYGDNYIGYALTFVKFSAAKSVAITFKHDDGAHLYLNGKLIGGDDTCNTGSGESLTLSFIQGWNCLEVVLNEKSGGEYIGLGTTISAISECQLMNCYYGTPVARQSHITNQLVENTTNIKGISTKVSKVTSVIGDNGENFTSFKNDYSDFKQTMNGFKTTVGQTYVTKDDFNGLEIGGRNLLLYSQTIRAHNDYYNVGWLTDEVETFNGCPVWSVKNQWGRLAWSFKSHVIDRGLVKVGDTLTYSLYAKTNNASGKSINCSYRFKGNAQAYWFKGSAFNIGTSWARYSATFTVTKDMLATDTYMNEIGFEETASMSGDDKVYFACPKLERGTKATDYTEAPEDNEVNGQNLVSNLPSNWEQGGINGGQVVGSTYASIKSSTTYRIRIKDIFPVSGNITVSAGGTTTNSAKETLSFYGTLYDAKKGLLRETGWKSFPSTINCGDAKYMSIILRWGDGTKTQITPSDISQICLKIERGTSATPFTLAPEDVNGKIVNVETIANQTAKQFEWIVKGGDKSSSMVLTDDFLNIVANNINLTGKVTFNSLSSDAKNEIGKVAQSKVDGLEVGGRNLLVQKNITEGYLSTDGKGSFVGSGGGDQTSDWIDVSGNKYITITLYEDFTNTNNSGRYCEYDADKNCINTVVYNPRQKSSIIIELKSNTKYIRVTAIECKTRRYKIEAGNKPTDWTPAPEDVSKDATDKSNQALSDAKKYSESAVNWVNSNGTNTNNLRDMVLKWTNNAVSTNTYIQGGWIATNTITADKIAIGDFTNYVEDPTFERGIYKDDKNFAIDSSIFYTGSKSLKMKSGTSGYAEYSLNDYKNFPVTSGEKIYVEWYGYRNGANQIVGINIEIMNETGESIVHDIPGYTSMSPTATDKTWIKYSHVATVTSNGFASISFKKRENGTLSGDWYVDNVIVRRMASGELIVDGAITADKIATDAIKSRNYISSGGTQGSFLNMSDGSFTAPNLSWDLNGNLIAKNANLSGEITATDGNIGKFKITDQWLITGSGSTCAGLGGSGQAFWAGAENSTVAPFRVEYDGKLYANGATISGDITATTGKIGDLTLKDGILTGTGSYSEPYTENDDGTVTSTITTNYITKLFGKGLTIDSTVKYSDEDDVYSYKVSVLPDEISFTDGEEIGMLGAGGLRILQVNDNSDSYSSEANEVSLSSGASNFYYTTPVNQTTDKYLHVCFSADGASFMASQGDKFNSFDIGYSSAKYSGNFAANKFVYTGNSLNYVECLEANDTTNIYFHSNGYYSFRVNNEGNWSNETQSVYITERGISVPGQIGLYSQEMSNYVARYYIAGSTKSTAIGNNSYQTRIYGSSVWANKAVSTSDVRLKQDFQSLDKFEDLYMQLQPVSFKYIDGYDKSEDRYFGLKAQPTEKLFEDMGENPDDYAMFNKFGIDHEDIKERIGYDVDFDEEHGLDYTNLITLNTHMVQKTRRELAELQKENAELKDMLKTIVKKINM